MKQPSKFSSRRFRTALALALSLFHVVQACHSVDATAKAQEAKQSKTPSGIEQNRPVATTGRRYKPFDEIVATVGNNVITRSGLRDSINAHIAAWKQESRKTNPSFAPTEEQEEAERQRIMIVLASIRARELLELKRLSDLEFPEDQVAKYIESKVNALVQEEKEAAGSQTALFKNLQAKGQRYDEFVNEIRNRVKMGLLRGEEHRKYRSSSALTVSPERMLDYYRRNKKNFESPTFAIVRAFSFTGATAAEVADNAASARAELASGKDVDAVCKTYSATCTTFERLLRDGSQKKFIRDFAYDEAVRIGQFSDPLPQPGDKGQAKTLLLQLVDRQIGGLLPFVNRRVQRSIRAELAADDLARFRIKSRQENSGPGNVWIKRAKN